MKFINITKDFILKNKLFSVFLLNTGQRVVKNKGKPLYKSLPLGLFIKYNDILYRLSYFSYKVVPMVVDYKVLNRNNKNIDKVHNRHSKTLLD